MTLATRLENLRHELWRQDRYAGYLMRVAPAARARYVLRRRKLALAILAQLDAELWRDAA